MKLFLSNYWQYTFHAAVSSAFLNTGFNLSLFFLMQSAQIVNYTRKHKNHFSSLIPHDFPVQ